MPLLTSSRLPITERVSDIRLDDTVFGQVARFRKLTHGQEQDGSCWVEILVSVQLWSLAGTQLGVPVERRGIREYEVTLKANNETLVDALTGEILLIRELDLVTQTLEIYEDWMLRIDQIAQTRVVMLQGDFFEQLRGMSPMPVGIQQMITDHIRNANLMQVHFA